VAWVAAWGGIMLVHYFWIEKRWPADGGRLFDSVGTRRLPGINWAGVVSLLVGIFATWLFMYGLIPVMQGPIAVALGGWDLSWLAGGLSSAACYAVLGPRVHRRFLADAGSQPVPAAVPETVALPSTTTAAL
jgi:toxin CptA